MGDIPIGEHRERPNSPSNETPAVGPHSIDPRPPFLVTRRSVDDFAAVLPEALVAAR